MSFSNAFASVGLTQIIREGTFFPSGSVLDLCLVLDLDRVGLTRVLPPLSGSYHCPILSGYIFRTQCAVINNDGQPDRLLAKGKYNLISECLGDVDWETDLSSLTVQDQFRKMLSILRLMIDRYIPVARKSSSASVPWAANPSRRLERARSTAWSNFKTISRDVGRHHQDNIHAWSAFQDINSSLKNDAIQSQNNYEISICSQLDYNPKLFHSYIKHRNICHPLVAPLKPSDGSLTDNPDVMAECFVSSFHSVSTSAQPPNPFAHQTCVSNKGMLDISLNDVESLLNKLHPNSGMGCELSLPLSIIFNLSLQSCSLPTQWLSSIIITKFKKTSRYDPRNYSPISLTSVMCKVLEKAIARHLTSYFEENSLISYFSLTNWIS